MCQWRLWCCSSHAVCKNLMKGSVNWQHQHFLPVVLWVLIIGAFSSLYRSVIVAPKKAGVMPSPGTSTPVLTTASASVSGGTPIDSVSVVSSSDASQSTSADSAACKHTDAQTQNRTAVLAEQRGQLSHRVDESAEEKVNIYLEIVLLYMSDGIMVFAQCNPVSSGWRTAWVTLIQLFKKLRQYRMWKKIKTFEAILGRCSARAHRAITKKMMWVCTKM